MLKPHDLKEYDPKFCFWCDSPVNKKDIVCKNCGCNPEPPKE